MKSSITLTVLGILIILLAGFATLNGLISSQPAEPMTTTSVFGEQVQLHGKGLYRRDSVSAAAQAQAQDAVTLLVGIPLLVISLAWARKGAMGGKLLLAGTLAYFLYTYTSMTFLSFYNQLFLVYVALFSLSLFALVLAFQQVDVESLPDRFSDRLPVKWIAGFLFFLSFMLLFMWMGRIVPSLDGRTPPVGLEHYTTLVIQALDLGIIIPTAVLAGALLLKKRPWGYMLSAVMLLKGLTLLLAICAMIMSMAMAGVETNLVEAAVFILFTLIDLVLVVALFRNVKSVEN
jgi:hypothetical protein